MNNKVDYDYRKSITFMVKIVGYQNPKHIWDISVKDVCDMLVRDEATVEFVYPYETETTLIVRPKDTNETED